MNYTPTELTAYEIMGRSGLFPMGYNTTSPMNIHEAANRFIEIAERIKAERAVCAMEANYE
uniref:Uncharacterized protein n=1 Tax=viral metagenome TaxID=1070528 RepID=A0A6M3LVM2_9ZZZZ